MQISVHFFPFFLHISQKTVPFLSSFPQHLMPFPRSPRFFLLGRCRRLSNAAFFSVHCAAYHAAPFLWVLHPPISIAALHRDCTLIAMGAQWMLKGCSMVAETILSTLSLICQASDHYPSVFLRLYRPACFQRLTHLVPHVVAQPPLNRLITPSRLAFGLIILGLPCRTTLRIIKNSFAGCYKIRKTLACRMSSFLLLRLFA